MDSKRKRLNRFGRYFVSKMGGGILSVNIDCSTPGFFRPDGVHLSNVGLEFYLDALRDSILDNLG